MALLKFQDESGAEQFVHVGPGKPEVTIGRVRSCDLVTTNVTVSRRHASVVWKDGAFVLHDLNSANGTFYNKQRTTQLVLKDGDSFLVGSLLINFELEPKDLKAAGIETSIKPSSGPAQEEPTVGVPGSPASVEAVRPEEDSTQVGPGKLQPVGQSVPKKPSTPAPESERPAEKPVEKPRAVPAAWKADWKPSGAVARPDAPRAPLPREPLPQAPAPRPEIVSSTPASDVGGRVQELEKRLELEGQDRSQLEQALKVAQERYYEAADRADRAEAEIVDIRSEIDLTSTENRELADRADELERENADLMQQIDDLRREGADRGAVADGVVRQAETARIEIDRLKAEKEAIELELKSARDTIKDLRSRPPAPSGQELQDALRTIEDLKLSNKGYLKRISRLLEELENKTPVGVAVPPEATGLSARLCELAGDALDTVGVSRALVAELRSSTISAETVSEIRNALMSLSEAVRDISAAANDLSVLLSPPDQD